MIDRPYVYDNFLPVTQYQELRDLIKHAPLSYGHKSSSKVDPYGHLKYAPIHDRQHNLADLAFQLPQGPLLDAWQVLGGRTGFGGSKLIRCYANGYTYGMDGYFHTDSQRTDEITVILYICDTWNRDWAGETCMADNKGGWWSIPPVPNRCLMIPSNMPHAARAVSRMCPEMRMTLMYKTRPARSPAFEKLSQWLVEHGALGENHASGTLHDHLVRTYAALEEKHAPDAAAYGGGLHSIYGTNVFKHKLLEPTEHARAAVASVFGAKAENLAWRFSHIARPKTLEDTTNKFASNKLTTSYGEDIWVGSEEATGLQLIEAANLLDQSSLDKWPNLKRLWDEYVPDHSTGERLVPRQPGGALSAAGG
jgi:hypothetical protein